MQMVSIDDPPTLNLVAFCAFHFGMRNTIKSNNLADNEQSAAYICHIDPFSQHLKHIRYFGHWGRGLLEYPIWNMYDHMYDHAVDW